jgi:catechol 2,3-dioxygenase-like lactoylglutathione lyase family enzyme
MAITLDHTIVPAHDKLASAKFFANLFGLSYDGPLGPFAPVRVNETLTFDFDDRRPRFEVHHYAFHVGEQEFDAIFGRVRDAGLAYGSQPWSHDDMQIRSLRGGRTVFFRDLDGHLLELRTRTSRHEAEDAALAHGAGTRE